MKIDREVPFYGNTPDDTHCFQAAMRMVLNYFDPKAEYSWGDLEKITAKPEGKWTWPMAGVMWLRNKGFKVRVIESFDYREFTREGGQYLIKEYGREVGQEQIKNSDVGQERKLAREYVEKVNIEKRIAAIKDIEKLINQGYIVGCNVNAKSLNKQKGYVGHFVVVKGLNEKSLILHDPGLPPMKNRIVSFDDFEKAWAYPDERSKGLIGFKLEESVG